MLFGLLGGRKKFDEEIEVPDLAGKVIFVTGGNSGLGFETCRVLAKHNPAHIYLAARNPEKAAEAIRQIQDVQPDAPVTFVQCDLTSLESVQKAAREFVAKEKRLDLLYANAGIMATPPGQTKEGYEIQFGTNHVGHALLIKLLLPTLLKTAEEPNSDVRVIVLSSAAHAWPAKNGVSFPDLKSPMTNTTTWGRYGQSKLANLMYASQLAKHYPSIKTVSIHPGVVATNLMGPTVTSSVLMKWANNIFGPLVTVKAPQGTWNQLWAGSVTREQLVSGEYYHPVGALGGRSTISKDEKLQDELWEWTQKELENYNL